MDILPYMRNVRKKSKKYTVNFGGLNRTEAHGDGELQDCGNLSSGRWPCLSPAGARVPEQSVTAPSALWAGEGLLVVDGDQVLYNGKSVGTVTPGPKQIAAVGKLVTIFPDKVCYNTADGSFSSMEATLEAAGLVFFSDNAESTVTAPEGTVWPFRTGDAIEISGCAAADNNKTIIVRGVEANVLKFYGNTLTDATETGTVTCRRAVPELELVCSANNRLWGVVGNTILGSKYGDPLNFYYYDGGAEASYAVEAGTDGPFTACTAYGGHICFFKEHVIHKLYGAKPSNFQLVTAHVSGVAAGCEKSLTMTQERLLYVGPGGVYAYAGGVPRLLSAKLGQVHGTGAAGACDGLRYWLSVGGELLVYDLQRDLWLREDAAPVVDMAYFGGSIRLLCQGGLWRMEPGKTTDAQWSATFCPIHETVDGRKGYSRLFLRADMTQGAELTVELQTDTDPVWRKVAAVTADGNGPRTVNIPILPTRCDSMTLRLWGRGDITVKTLLREFSVGSAV